MTVNNTLRIFLVDDDIFYKAIFQQLMSSLGYNNVYYYSSVEDIISENNKDVDVIFIDYGINTAACIAILKLLKHKNPNWYVVFISANENAGIIADSVKLGAFAYVVKGNNEAEKIETILAKIVQIQNLLKTNRHKLH